jgi:TRAP-type C4-dicarboxylate transport system substrate-binding protein
MQMTRRAVVSAALVGTLLALPALRAARAQETTLILGGSDAIGSIIDRTNAHFTRLVNERARGRLRVNFIQGEQLGNDVQVIEQMMRGGVQVYGDVLDWYANWVRDLSVLAWGFTFRDFAHQQRFLDSPIFAPYAEELRARHNVRLLAAAPSQPRVMFSKRPISSPADLRGLKMRVPDIRAYLLLWQTLGTQPSRVAWGEVFLGLRTGVIDAAEGPTLSALAARFHQAAPQVVRTDHVISAAQISMNEQAYQRLSPELKEIVTAAAREAMAWQQEQSVRELDAAYDQMRREGATVGTVDRAPFVAAALEGVATMERDNVWSSGLFQRIQAL